MSNRSTHMAIKAEDRISTSFMGMFMPSIFTLSPPMSLRITAEIEEEKRETLWPTYVAILRSTAYGTVKTTIAKNREFLRQVMKQRGYKGMRQENRKFFTIIYKDTECLKDAEEYGEDFLEEYLSKISGFQNEDAAQEFLRIMQEHPKLRGNAGIY